MWAGQPHTTSGRVQRSHGLGGEGAGKKGGERSLFVGEGKDVHFLREKKALPWEEGGLGRGLGSPRPPGNQIGLFSITEGGKDEALKKGVCPSREKLPSLSKRHQGGACTKGGKRGGVRVEGGTPLRKGGEKATLGQKTG